MLFCFLFTLLLLPKVIRQLIKWKVGDRPEFDHAPLNALTRDKSNVPTMGGLIILLSVALGMLLLADLTNFYVRMGLICLVWLGALGAADDWLKLTAARRGSGSRDGLKTYEKLLFQIGLAVVLGYFIYSHGQHNFAVLGPYAESAVTPAYQHLDVPFYKSGLPLGAAGFMIVAVVVMTGTSNAGQPDRRDGRSGVRLCGDVCGCLSDSDQHCGRRGNGRQAAVPACTQER